ncbi:hypothetical protein C8F04DRAFT_1321909 [Mycena alexandri]|uniref:Uncharacterized protein n=1 Tax=Mycena alexandri TaxID=1745969 RepID=A0AAD6S237_9AGAR|nr:hypothetical protein C8F04DRAFT_1321909 [Mycena alexandri]
MKYAVDSGLFDYNWFVLSTQIIAACVQLVLYGIYLVLFILAIYTLARRRAAGKNLMLGYTSVMAIFGTAQFVIFLIHTAVVARFVEVLVKQDVTSNSTPNAELAKLVSTKNSLFTAQQIIFAGNNMVTDTLLLYRCFVLWGSRRRLFVIPAILIACTFAVGCASALIVAVPSSVPYVAAALTNLLLVGLIAGRIWWIRRDARVVAGNGLRKRYNTVIEMILESGVLYLVVAVLLAVFQDGIVFNSVLLSVGVHMINIVPTLIIVRVGLRHNIQDTGQTRATNHPLLELSAHRPLKSSIPRVLDMKPSEYT